YELIGRKGATTSVTRSAAGGPRLIGRQEELASILTAFADAVAGRGSVAQLTAEAGIGKSHLIASALSELDPQRAVVVSGASQSFERTTPYRLWRGVFRSFFGIDGNMDAADQLAAVTATVAALDSSLV